MSAFRAWPGIVAAIACACSPAAAGAAQTVTFHASFEPNRLGASTTIAFGFEIASSNGEPPAPLTGVDLHLPAGMGLATTTLGQANCVPSALITVGLSGCSSNSRIGIGKAVIEVPFGPSIVQETANITVFIGPVNNLHTQLLFFAEGWHPLFAELIFPGQMLSDSPPFGGRIDTTIPLVPTVPYAADATVIGFQATIGPSHLTYHKRIRDSTVSYRPHGLAIPRTCPRGGFPFAADFSFEDGSTSKSKTSVPCPQAHASRA